MANEEVKLFISMKRNREPLPRPMSADMLGEAVLAAKAMLEQKMSNPQWVEHITLEEEVKEADEENANSSERLRKLRAQWDQLNVAIWAQKRRLANLSATLERRKRAHDEHVVPAEVSSEIELALQQHKKAKIDQSDGIVRNAEKNVKAHVEKVLRDLAKDPGHMFDFDEMVPLLVWHMIGWHGEMRCTIDSPDKKPTADDDLAFEAENVLSQFKHMVKKTGCSKHVVLDCLKNLILPLTHKMDGCKVWGMNPKEDGHTGKVLCRDL